MGFLPKMRIISNPLKESGKILNAAGESGFATGIFQKKTTQNWFVFAKKLVFGGVNWRH